jgi:predicted ATPase/DNA-binding CsgD family transcriptional regulator
LFSHKCCFADTILLFSLETFWGELLVNELNEREIEIIALLAEGLANKEIAERLFLAPNTVKWYIKQINSKLDTSNRDEIVQAAQNRKLLNREAEAKPQYKRPKTNLPRQSSPFVGRDAELDELHSILEKPDLRLITILAQGGMGKTRLALEAAEQQKERFRDGVFFVGLQALSDTEQIIPAFAESLSYYFQSDARSQKEQILDFLAHKEMLLVTDNWEHLLDGVSLLNELLEAAPKLKILATSREKLQLLGETVYVLRGMEFPNWESPEDVLEYDAVQLLVQAAQRVKPDWRVTQDNLDFVSRVCRLTQGMPLGILLAVTWLDMLSIREIAEEVSASADFLEAHFANVSERQHSIRAVFNYAWNRLSQQEQQVFMKLSIFRGGFSRDAANEIAGASLQSLHRLMEKALVMRLENEDYDLHELLRQYAEEKLKQSDDEMASRDKHASYYLRFAAELRPQLKDSRQKEAVKALTSNFENFRNAWLWAVEREEIDLLVNTAETLWFYGDFAFALREVRALASFATAKLIAIGKNHSLSYAHLRITEAITTTFSATSLGEYFLAQSYCEEALPIAEAHQAHYELYIGKRILAEIFYILSEWEKANQLAYEMLEHTRNLKDDYYIADTYQLIALVNSDTEHWQEMRENIEKAYTMFKQLGDPNRTAGQLGKLGRYYWNLCQFDKAESYFREALAIREKLGFWGYRLTTANDLAQLLYLKGELQEAEKRFQEINRDAQELGFEAAIATSFVGLSKIFVAKGAYAESLEIIRHLYKTTKLDKQQLRTGIFIRQQLRAGILILPLALNAQWDEMRDELQLFMQNYPEHYMRIPNVQFNFSFELLSLIHADWGASRAVEILSLIINHEKSPKVFSIHAFSQKGYQDWEAELGKEAFEAAWERGKQLDLDKICKEIFDFYKQV